MVDDASHTGVLWRSLNLRARVDGYVFGFSLLVAGVAGVFWLAHFILLLFMHVIFLSFSLFFCN